MKLQDDPTEGQLKKNKVSITKLSAPISGIAFGGKMRGTDEKGAKQQ